MGVLRLQEFVPSPSPLEGSELHIHVIYTSPEATSCALSVASQYARDLGGRLELLAPKVVPYPRQLQDPTIADSFTEGTLRALVSGCDAAVEVNILLCRDTEETVSRWLPRESITILGRRRRWGPGSFRRLVRTLTRHGHQVVVVDVGRPQPAQLLSCGRRPRL
jgi:hypothetical protein